MTGIISTGIGSGLDIQSIVTQLVAAEGAPVEGQLARREATVQSKLSAFGSLKASLSTLQSAAEGIATQEDILKRKVTSADEESFTAEITGTASPANYAIEVINVASAQRLTSGVFADSTATVGTGTLTLTVGTDSVDIEVAQGDNSLSAIRDAINGSAENPGVSATIVNADAGSYLILTAEKTGTGNEITVTQTGGDGGLSALEYDSSTGLGSLTESQAADDARIRIDGFEVQSSTNTFAAAIDGVSIEVLQGTEGTTRNLLVENDFDATKTEISRFVTAYNSLVDLNQTLTAFDQDSGSAGALLGDATLRGIVNQVRNEMNSAVSGAGGVFNLLGDIGIELQLDGKFTIDQAALDDALDQDFSRVGQLFTSEDGFATRLAATTETFLQSDGILQIRTDGLDSQVERINEQRERLELRLTSLEERLFRQYNALDSLLAELSNTSTFLNAQLQNLPGFTRDNN
ncbi:MAG: flagellar filament capping protein FliD [Pseudomonadota bacterium]